jgi:hypothetical protein
MMHFGTGAAPSNTGAMYFPPTRRLNSDADTSMLDVLDYPRESYRLHLFYDGIYLGSIVYHSLTSDADVDKHNRPSSAAFRALKNILTTKDIDLKVKDSVYVALCISILLYGS